MPYTIIDPKLVPYQKEFIETVQAYCPVYMYLHPIQTTIYFDKLIPNRIAYSLTNGWTRVRFVFDKEHWDKANEDSRYATAIHEFSHGYLGMDHSTDPNNYMFAYDFIISKEEVKKQLITALKERCK